LQHDAETDPSLLLVRRAVDGDATAMRKLVRELTPIVRAGVCWVLTRGRAPGRREARQEIEDVTQTVLLALFMDRGRVLLQWDPSRGLDLAGFVALLARRETVAVLRSRRRSPWTEDPTLLEELDHFAVSRMGPESEAISRDLLATLADTVRHRLSERGARIFDLMFLEGRPVEEVCEMTGISADSFYTWRSRLQRLVREILAEIARTIPPPERASRPPPDLQIPRLRVPGDPTPPRGSPAVRRAGGGVVLARTRAVMARPERGSSAPPPPSER
jgi:RNA polymerase sigma-70 factor (ECF subfamily)